MKILIPFLLALSACSGTGAGFATITASCPMGDVRAVRSETSSTSRVSEACVTITTQASPSTNTPTVPVSVTVPVNGPGGGASVGGLGALLPSTGVMMTPTVPAPAIP